MLNVLGSFFQGPVLSRWVGIVIAHPRRRMAYYVVYRCLGHLVHWSTPFGLHGMPVSPSAGSHAIALALELANVTPIDSMLIDD